MARACLVGSGPVWSGPKDGVGNEVRAVSFILYNSVVLHRAYTHLRTCPGLAWSSLLWPRQRQSGVDGVGTSFSVLN